MSTVGGNLSQEAYYHVLAVANLVLRACRIYSFSIEALRNENPTIAEMVRGMRLICELIEKLADCDGHTLSKAHEYTDNIQRMAEAVEREDEEELRRQYEILNKRPFL